MYTVCVCVCVAGGGRGIRVSAMQCVVYAGGKVEFIRTGTTN